jgi:ElaA protein
MRETTWCWNTLDDFAPRALYAMLALRVDVFVVEQACAYAELDGLDAVALHRVGWEGERAIACLRVLPPSEGFPDVRIGRVAVARDRRGRGLARALMEAALERIAADHPHHAVTLSAQSYLERFYAGFGFRVTGPEYDEDGIPHLPMRRPVPA